MGELTYSWQEPGVHLRQMYAEFGQQCSEEKREQSALDHVLHLLS